MKMKESEEYAEKGKDFVEMARCIESIADERRRAGISTNTLAESLACLWHVKDTHCKHAIIYMVESPTNWVRPKINSKVWGQRLSDYLYILGYSEQKLKKVAGLIGKFNNIKYVEPNREIRAMRVLI